MYDYGILENVKGIEMTLNYQIREEENLKVLTSEEYNYVFNKENLTLIRWGTTKQDNPVWAPFGPELVIIDVNEMSIELFTIVLDISNAGCTITTANLLNTEASKHMAHVSYTLDKSIIPISELNLEQPIETGLFSLYVNNKGIVKPASTCSEGIDIMSVNNFYKDVWQSPLFKKYRWELLQRRQ